MLDRQQLAVFASLAPRQEIIAGCRVRLRSNARQAAVATRRIVLAMVVLVALPLSIVVLAKVGIVWIGAIFVIGPAISVANRTTSGLSAKATVFQCLLTEHSLLLVETAHDAPLVAHAFARSTVSDVRVRRGRNLDVTSAGRRVRLITDGSSDAAQMASLMRG
jgi:hypothetical protein